MMENINSYLILTTCFFLLFLLIFLLFERYKKRGRALLEKHSRVSIKIPWDKVIKGFAVAAFILFLRKVIYYVPLVGIIQTKFSIWWVDGHVLAFLLLFLVGYIGLFIMSTDPHELKTILTFWVSFSISISAVLSFILLSTLPADFGKRPTDLQTLATLILTSLLMLKMLCGGKYLGILISFVVGYFIIGNYEKLNPKKYRVNKKFLTALGCIILVFLTFCVLKFPGNWEKRFTGKGKVAKSEREIMDLLEAANSILDENHKEIALKEIAVAAAKIGNIEWAMDIAKKLRYTNLKNAAFKEIKEIRKNQEKIRIK